MINTDFVSWLFQQLSYILTFVVQLLPDSPFALLDYTVISPYLGFINYFLPLDYILSLLSAWLVAITVFYCYRQILSFTRVIN